jgi:hypothetical protein
MDLPDYFAALHFVKKPRVTSWKNLVKLRGKTKTP